MRFKQGSTSSPLHKAVESLSSFSNDSYSIDIWAADGEETSRIDAWRRRFSNPRCRGCPRKSLAKVRRGHYEPRSYSFACSLLSLTTVLREAAAAVVVVAARFASLRTLLNILPLGLLGMASMNSTSQSALYLTFFSLT
jgi:hypothetical protein